MFHLNARVPQETKDQLDKIVEYYRAKLTVGRVSQGHVLQDIIKKAFEQIEKEQQKD